MEHSLELTKLLAARHRATRARPYLAGALHAITVVSSPMARTMAVDRYWRCYAAPLFVAATPVEELAAVWLHEVSHLLRDHHGRAQRLVERSRAEAGLDERSRTRPFIDPEHPQREQLRMNLAMDCEINDDLLEDLLDDQREDLSRGLTGRPAIRLPSGAVRPKMLDLKDEPLFEGYLGQLSASSLHGRLTWLDCGSGAHDGEAPWELGPDGAHPLSAAEAATIRIKVAEQIRRGRGRAPASWRRWAEDVGRSQQDWRRLLQAAIRSSLRPVTGSADYAYRRPGRRGVALGGGVVLPSLVRPLPAVAVVIDTSASVADTELGTALSETAGILQATGTSSCRIRVYSCDAAVHTAQNVCATQQIALIGGGGTDLRIGMAKALAARPSPDVVVVITDGGTPWPATQPRCRVVVGLLGPKPQLDDKGFWHPPPPPTWAHAIRLSDNR